MALSRSRDPPRSSGLRRDEFISRPDDGQLTCENDTTQHHFLKGIPISRVVMCGP
jgi:hypothetical protein